jgi:tetratricopeptide (TPR) repeat protein
MKKIAIFLLIVIIIIGLFYSISTSQTINVKDYIKDKFPSIFGFYLSSFEDLDSYEKEFIDLLEKLPGKEQEYYAKEVYKSGFSLELLKSLKDGKTTQAPTASKPALPKQKEESTENLPTIIKRIEPSTIIVFTYDNKGEFLKLGSGFFISQNGDIITNYHVLQGASLDISSKYVHPLSLSTTIPEVGERIIVYGSPLGLEKTVSDGIVSAIREVPGYGKLIQITAPISPGSSGSPVLNMKGEVIGVATFQMIEGQNLNFAIPSERIANLNLMEEEKTFTTEELFEPEEKDKKDSDYAYEAYDKALYFIDKREYEKALPYLEITIKTDISSLKAWAYFQIGYCYGELKSYAKAIEAFKQAIRIDPDDAIAHYNLGFAYDKLGSYKDAIEAYKRAIRIDPDYADAHRNLGLAYYKLGLYRDAIEAYKQAIRIDPDDAIAHCNLGAAYGRLGFYKDAIEAYIQAIHIDPDYTMAHYGLGLMYLITGDRNLALNEYKILKNLDIDLANRLFDFIY